MIRGPIHLGHLGQVRDVCDQIRIWLQSGETARASYWSRRLRGERHVCSVEGCGSPPLSDRTWCKHHRVVMDVTPSRPDWWGDAIEMLREDPTLTDGEVGAVVGRSGWQVGAARVSEGIASSWYRRHGYLTIGDIPAASRAKVRQGEALL